MSEMLPWVCPSCSNGPSYCTCVQIKPPWYVTEIRSLQQQLKEAREALKDYADKFNWRTNSGKVGITPLTNGEDSEQIDGQWTNGKTARAFFEKFPKKEGD